MAAASRFRDQKSNSRRGSCSVAGKGFCEFRTCCLLPAAGLLAFAVAFAPSAHGQDSLIPPLSQSVGSPIYSENSQNGPSTTLVEGDNNLNQPFLRGGISDPLSFLIESGFMSPYLLDGSLANSYAYGDVQTQLINDSIVAERVSEYRSNRELMGGAGGSSLSTGRAALAGATLSGFSNARAADPAASGFSGIAARAPFAAGSSALASREAGTASGGAVDFVNPNAVVMAATISSSLGALQANLSSGNSVGASPSAAATTLTLGGNASVSLGSVPLSVLIPPPNSTAIGPGPGEPFPDVAASGPSATGFPDSTMGTAGLAYMLDETNPSPLLSSHTSSSEAPFASLSQESRRYLNPSLRGTAAGPPDRTSSAGPPLSVVVRKARMHAMIYNPGAPLPTPFEQRAMERAYLRKQSGQRVSHYPDLTAPSIRP